MLDYHLSYLLAYLAKLQFLFATLLRHVCHRHTLCNIHIHVTCIKCMLCITLTHPSMYAYNVVVLLIYVHVYVSYNTLYAHYFHLMLHSFAHSNTVQINTIFGGFPVEFTHSC